MVTKVIIGCDNAAVELKNILTEFIQSLGYEVEIYGAKNSSDSSLYPDIAFEVASAISRSKDSLGILCCGTGIGMAISANKVSGIRAAQAHDVYSAKRARGSNNAHIITLGARVIGPELAKEIAKAFLDSEFEPERSANKVERIHQLEVEADSSK